MKMRKGLFLVLCFLLSVHVGQAATPEIDYLSYAKSVANSEMSRKTLPDLLESSPYRTTWNYKLAFLSNAYIKLYEATQVEKYYDYVKATADNFLDEQGMILAYDAEAFDLRNICGGIFLYGTYYQNRGGNKYLNAMISLRKQLHKQPRTQERAFWFSQSHANELWIEGLYMAMPFYCLYASVLDEPKIFNDVATQFTIVDYQTLDKETGLNYQAWDEKKVRTWANKTTGTTTALLGQSIGFYIMAIVDVLDYFPINHKYRNELIKTLNRITTALINYQEPKTGMWYQVVNTPKDENNFWESSSTAMYTYAIAKGVNKGYLPKKYRSIAEKAFEGLILNCIDYDKEAETGVVTKATGNADLVDGDGTFEYYTSLPLKNHEPNATAAFILAAVELAK